VLVVWDWAVPGHPHAHDPVVAALLRYWV